MGMWVTPVRPRELLRPELGLLPHPGQRASGWGLLFRRHSFHPPPPTEVSLTLTHTWRYLWQPQTLPRPAERQLAASPPYSCPGLAWKPSDLTKLCGFLANQQGYLPAPPPPHPQARQEHFSLTGSGCNKIPAFCTGSPHPSGDGGSYAAPGLCPKARVFFPSYLSKIPYHLRVQF